MAWANEEIAGLLREYAELTQITGGDVFRARNYEKAARSVRGWADDISQLDATGLRTIPGVGASIAAKIAEYRETGRIKALDELRAKIPPGVLELTRVPGLGPKRALQLNHDLGVQSVDDLAVAIKAGKLDGLAGFGAKSEERLASGPTKTSVRTARGLQVDLRVVPLDAWGAALQYFTGSAAHNVALRQIAVRQKLRLSEYGLFDVKKGTGEVGGTLIVSRTEEEVYARLGLAWVPPAMREDHGEIEAAIRGEIPRLVRENDLKGDLHTHTDLTDGVASLDVMVAAARQRGYAYYAITDHAPNLIMQRMTDEKMLAQRDRVRALDPNMELLHGTELNIGPDGSVDWDADFLDGFDLCVASVHSHFEQPRAEMTRRFIAACENPHVNIIGHPTTRRIGKRPPVEVDFGELFRACARTGTALEINASPQRLDLPSDHIRAARDAGVKFAIDSDAHSTSDLGNMPYGVGTAQRGWLTPDDVINTWPLDKLRAFLRKAR
jgi:DNA polymerase (family 10)